MATKKVSEHLQRFEHLSGKRSNWEAHWQEISEVVLPRRGDFTGRQERGGKRGLNAVDSTAIIANELLAAGLHGMLTNPASKWFMLRLTDEHLMEERDVKTWLQEVERRIYIHLNAPAASFASHMHELYMDLTAFGTAIMFVGERDIDSQLTFSTRHLKECYLAENSDGYIDTVYRKFDFTARQIVQRWGEKKVSRRIRECYDKGKLDETFTIVHCVYPRMDTDYKSKRRDQMPVASLYILQQDQHILHEGGYEEMPYVAPRWVKAAGEVYGRGPGMATLPDVKMLQEMTKTVLKAAQKIVDPPLQLEDDSLLSPVRTVPGGLNFRRAGSEKIEPLMTGANIPIGLDMLQDVRVRIREGFFIDQLQLHQGPQMTATEVLQRTEEKLRLLGPVLGRLQSELLGPMIERVFGMLSRRGQLPELPPVLEEANYNIEYVSPLARAQRQIEANGLLRIFEIGGPLAEFDPSSMQVIKGDETIRWLGELFGVPNHLFLSRDEAQELKQMQAEQAQQAQMLAQAQQGADVVNKIAPLANGNAGQAA